MAYQQDLFITIDEVERWCDSAKPIPSPDFIPKIFCKDDFENSTPTMANDPFIELPTEMPPSQPTIQDSIYRSKVFFARYGDIPNRAYRLIHGGLAAKTTKSVSLDEKGWNKRIDTFRTKQNLKMRGASSFIRLFVTFNVHWIVAQGILDKVYLNACMYSIVPDNESDEQRVVHEAAAFNWVERYRPIQQIMRDNIQYKITNMQLDLANELSAQRTLSVEAEAKKEKAIKKATSNVWSAEPHNSIGPIVIGSPNG